MSVQVNPPGGETSTILEDWPCFMNDGVGTHSLTETSTT